MNIGSLEAKRTALVAVGHLSKGASIIEEHATQFMTNKISSELMLCCICGCYHAQQQTHTHTHAR